MTWYEMERANLFQALETAQRQRLGYLAWYLPMAVAPFAEETWSWRELEASSLAAWSFVEHEGDSVDKSWILRQIGQARRQQHEFASATEATMAALRESRRAGDLPGIAHCLTGLGTEASLSASELGDQNTLATGLRNLGYTYFVLERMDEAQSALERALPISQGVKDHYIY